MKRALNFLVLLPLLLSASCSSKNEKVYFEMEGAEHETYYSDDYFFLNNKELHEEIAHVSGALEFTCFDGTKDYQNRYKKPKKFWKSIGFSNIYFNPAFINKPTSHSIGYGIASKTIHNDGGTYTLISTMVRGSDYEAEWISNITIGVEGNAQGFDEAATEVKRGIEEYIINNNITGNVKFWITGYSRAAATANMTAAKIIDNKIPNVNYSDKDMYCYAYETPMGALVSVDEARSDKYLGIHNFINYNDLVPLVAPSRWGMTRYGTDHYFPDRLNDIYFEAGVREKMVMQYHFNKRESGSGDYVIDDWKFFDVGERLAEVNNLPRESIHPSMGRSVHLLFDYLSGRIVEEPMLTRESYYVLAEGGLTELFEIFFGLSEDFEELKIADVINVIFSSPLFNMLLDDLQDGRIDDFMADALSLMTSILIPKNENRAVIDLYDKNAYFLNALATTFILRKDLCAQFLYKGNLMGIISPHLLALDFPFVEACDTRFMGKDACSYNDGSYYILRVTNPSELYIYENNLKTNVFDYSYFEMKSNYLSAEKYYDGRIDVYLPKNGSYKITGNYNDLSLINVDPMLGESLVQEGLTGDYNL